MFNSIAIKTPSLTHLGALLLLSLLLLGCSGEESPNEETPVAAESSPSEAPVAEVEAVVEATFTAEPVNTATPMLTPTPQLAAFVNNEPILLSVFEQQLAEYEQAQANLDLPLESDYRERVFLDLVEQIVLEQAAESLGIIVNADMVQARIDELMEQSGGAENFAAWLEANQTTAEAFRELIGEELLTSAILQNVTADVPYEAPHIRASYLQVTDAEQAEAIYNELQETGDFAAAAQTYSLDRATGENGGDLGYFAEGDLLLPEVEAAAWQLGVGEISQVFPAVLVDNQTIYCIVTLTEASASRPLSEGKRAILLQQTFENWLAGQLVSAEIVRFVE